MINFENYKKLASMTINLKKYYVIESNPCCFLSDTYSSENPNTCKDMSNE